MYGRDVGQEQLLLAANLLRLVEQVPVVLITGHHVDDHTIRIRDGTLQTYTRERVTMRQDVAVLDCGTANSMFAIG